jgi:hypothetical protein
MTLLSRLSRLEKLSNESRKMGFDSDDISVLRWYLASSLSQRNRMFRCKQLDTKAMRRIANRMVSWRVIDEVRRQQKDFLGSDIYSLVALLKKYKKPETTPEAK